VETKVTKGKATDVALRDARTLKENAERELEEFKQRTVPEAFANLTKAYHDMYSNGLQLMSKQMANIQGSSMVRHLKEWKSMVKVEIVLEIPSQYCSSR
jgi:hypothetical protein